jgi:hypothetical protein
LKEILSFIVDFFKHVIAEHPENVFFYLIGSTILTAVIVRNERVFRKGLEGANGLFEAPEIVIYLWVWLFPQSILAVLFLDLKPPDMFWFFMLGCLLFAFAGRDGVYALLNWRGVTMTKTTTTEKTEISKEITQEKKPNNESENP